MNIQIETVTAGHFTMDYFKFGCGGKTLVILPGLSVQSVMGFADSVADSYRGFSDDFTVYVFDRRKELPAAYSIYDMAKDTAEAIRTLGLSGINLFGASQGGMIAMEIAAMHPDLVQKMVLGSTSSCIGRTQREGIEKWIRLAKNGDRTGLYLAFGEAVYPKDVFEQSRALLAKAAESVTEKDLERFVVLADAARDFDVTGDLWRIKCPVLVIGSLDDRVLGSAASVRIAENLSGQKGVVLYLYDGYGHAAYDTAPDYRERMLAFFS